LALKVERFISGLGRFFKLTVCGKPGNKGKTVDALGAFDFVDNAFDTVLL
jgi:hypothetical protein